MSHNLGNGGTFGIDVLVRTPGELVPSFPPMVLPAKYGEAPKLPPESKLCYFITDYEQNISLDASDAAIAAILILNDVFERDLRIKLKRPSLEELSELKAVLEKITKNGLIREQAV